jgi:putative copper export protein
VTADVLVATVVRGIDYAALLALIGGVGLEVFVLPRGDSALDPARRRLRRLAGLCAIALAVATLGELLIRTRTMAGGSLSTALAAVPAVLTRTHFGVIWIARLAAIALALIASAIPAFAARVVLFALALFVAATTSLTGHAGDWGDLTLSAGVDWLHIAAVSLWSGGLMALAVAVLGERRRWPHALLCAVMRRFSRLAGLCLVVVLATGIYNACVQLSSPSALWTTVYGRWLAVKLALVVGLIWWGAFNRYTVLPALDRRRRMGIGERCFRLARWAIRGSRHRMRDAAARLGTFVGREALLALAVVAATAALVDSAPPRHVDHASHERTQEPTSYRLTMEELHRQGGVPRGWSFTPPDGNPDHGRQIFAALGCPACHRVSAAEPQSGPGPDLIGVGEHHPAGYLLESIVNPNAVIVEGPGYTAPDGNSIMPDYRGRLSVNDLIDLVTYLKTL